MDECLKRLLGRKVIVKYGVGRKRWYKVGVLVEVAETYVRISTAIIGKALIRSVSPYPRDTYRDTWVCGQQ